MAYSIAHTFALNYKKNLTKFKKIAKNLGIILTQILDKEGILYQSIQTRAKDPYSVEKKIMQKNYTHPYDKITDLVGARIVVYYEEDISVVEKVIREYFQVNDSRSIDKRKSLSPREFGYTARHFVAQKKKQKLITPEYEDLKHIWFEIQVCTVLGHAWAEIEHQIVYNATTDYPNHVERRFGAIAGTLELLDREFSRLRKEESNLISEYVSQLEKGNPAKPIDKAWMIAILEHIFPHHPGWRKADAEGEPLKKDLGDRCCVALQRARIKNTSLFQRLLSKKELKSAIKEYATNKGLSPEEVSHFAIVVLALIILKTKIIRNEFSDFLEDLPMMQTFKSICKRKTRR